MISDILSDALSDIESYQKEHPDTYTEFAFEIGLVKDMMDGLMIVLDSSHVIDDEYGKLIAGMRGAIRRSKSSGVLVARHRIRKWVMKERKRIDGDVSQ